MAVDKHSQLELVASMVDAVTEDPSAAIMVVSGYLLSSLYDHMSASLILTSTRKSLSRFLWTSGVCMLLSWWVAWEEWCLAMISHGRACC